MFTLLSLSFIIKIISFGDLNCDFNFPSKHLVDILLMFQLHQLTNSDIRISPTSSTCTDLVITQTPQVIKSIEVLAEICSDRCVPCAIKTKTGERIGLTGT